MKEIEVFGNRAIIIPDETEKKKGLIEIPVTSQEEPVTGEILAAGSGAITKKGTSIPMGLKKGDRVLFDRYAGVLLQVDGRELQLLKGEKIYAVLEG